MQLQARIKNNSFTNDYKVSKQKFSENLIKIGKIVEDLIESCLKIGK